jgi:O-antigen/teichoic acid export membrane protein
MNFRATGVESLGPQTVSVNPGQSRLAKVMILSSGQALTMLVGIISTAVLARVFSQNDYASYRQALLAFTFALPFVTLGLDKALYYFLPGDEKRSRGILCENLLLLLCGGLLLSLFLMSGGNILLARRFNNPDLANLLLLLAPYPLFVLPAASLASCLMARDRTGQVAGFNIASRALLFAAIVVPGLLWATPSSAIAGTMAWAAVTTAIAVALMFRACNAGSWKPTMDGLLKQIRFSVPLGLATLVGAVSLSLDQVMVASLCAPAVFAVYVNGAVEIPVISMVSGSAASVLLVDYARLYREGRVQEMIVLIHRAMVKSALFLLPAMVYLFCVGPELMRFVFGAAYAESSVPFRVYLLMLPVRTLNFGAVLQATGNSSRILVQSLIALATNAILLWWAIGLLGPLLAPVGPVLSLYLFVVPYLVFSLSKILCCRVTSLFPWAELIRLMAASCIALPVVIALKYLAAGWPDALMLFVSAVLYGGITFAVFCLMGWRDVFPWRGWIGKLLGR